MFGQSTYICNYLKMLQQISLHIQIYIINKYVIINIYLHIRTEKFGAFFSHKYNIDILHHVIYILIDVPAFPKMRWQFTTPSATSWVDMFIFFPLHKIEHILIFANLIDEKWNLVFILIDISPTIC